MPEETYVVFGQKPYHDPFATAAKKYIPSKKGKKKYLQSSPYNTPVVNDPNLIPSLTIEAKLKLEKKLMAARMKTVVADEDSLEAAPSDFFECYVSADMVKKIRICWNILTTLNPDMSHTVTMNHSWTIQSMPSFSQSRMGLDSVGGSQVIPAATMGTLPWARGHDVNEGLQESSVFSQAIGFQASIDDSAVIPSVENQSMRFSKANTMSTFKTWTPHELALQKVVHKRGGELFILTAATTKGRMKPPYRRSRFVRLEDDLERVSQQCNMHGMMKEDIVSHLRVTDHDEKKSDDAVLSKEVKDQLAYLTDSLIHINRRRAALKYVRDSFKVVYDGDVKDLNRLRRLRALPDGATLSTDEELSQLLEYKMAYRIQCLFFRALAPSRREKMKMDQVTAASKIQTAFRSMRGRRLFKEALARISAGNLMRRINEKLLGMARMLALKKEAKQRWASKLIQRAWRGYKGREKIYLKRIFIKHVNQAQKEAEGLSPGIIQGLVDELDEYMHNYEMVIPVEVASVIRGVMFMLNGDDPEVITVIEDDNTETKELFAHNMTWGDCLRFIRRKGKLLRRIRTLAKHISLPSACPLEFSDSCNEFMEEVCEKIEEKVFRYFNAKKPISMLFRYIINLKKAYDMQSSFPEYFGASSPLWFRELLDYRLDYENKNMAHRVAGITYNYLEVLKQEKIRQGKKWGNITTAAVKAQSDLNHAEFRKQLAQKKMDSYMKKLLKNEAHKMSNMVSLRDTTEMGLKVSQREVRDYLATNEFVDEKIVRMYYFQIDEKSIALREVMSDIITANIQAERDQKSREFEHLFNFTNIYDYCEKLGKLVSEMLIYQGQWDEFIDGIGGLQFVQDLYGEKLKYFRDMKSRILSCIDQRRELTNLIKQDIAAQIKFIKRNAAELRTIAYNERADWDSPYPIVIEAEADEDIVCARRDVEAANRKLKQPNFFEIQPAKVVTVLLIVDLKIPKKTRLELVELLFKYNYSVAVTLEGDDFNSVIPPIQKAIEQGQSAILFVEKGIDVVGRATFNACFRTALLTFVPKPRVLSLDGTFTLTALNWHSELAPYQESIAMDDTSASTLAPTQLLLGKVRSLVGMFKHCMRIGRNRHIDPVSGKPFATAFNHVPDWLPDLFVKDYHEYLSSIFVSEEYPSIVVQPGQSLVQHPSLYISQEWSSYNSGHTPPYIVLAATVSAMLEKWLPPITEWRGKHYREGLHAFVELAKDPDELIQLMMYSPYPITTPLSWKRVEKVMQLQQVWAQLAASKLYETPVIYVLTQWALTCAQFLNSSYVKGGTVPVVDTFGIIEKTRELNWEEDVLAKHFDSVIGDILHESLRNSLLFSSNNFSMNTFVSKANYKDPTYQMMSATVSNRSISVYQTGKDILVEVGIETRDASGKDVTHMKRYFNKVSTSRFISGLQPNTTEIYEGRIPKFVFDENYNWPEKVAEYTRLTVPQTGLIGPDDRVVLDTSRCKYMQLSLLGLINGHFCRVELYEEGFGDLTGSIYGISQQPMNFRIDDATYDRVMYRSDPEEERTFLENYDAAQISSIFADRLTVIPSRRMEEVMREVSGLSCRDPTNPSTIPKSITFRLPKGPGRLLGEVTKRIGGTLLMVSIFEVHGNSDVNMLRMRLYDPETSQSVEYRISGMERLLLFDKKKPILSQMINKLKLVKIDPANVPRCPVLYLREPKDLKIQRPENVLEGETMYDLITPSQFAEDTDEKPGLKVKDFLFGVTFDRAALRQMFGNIELGVSLALHYQGFMCTLYDYSTLVMASVVLRYKEASAVFLGKDYSSLMEEIAVIDDADTAMDLIEDLIDTADIDEYEGPVTPPESDASEEDSIPDSEDSAAMRRYKKKKAREEALRLHAKLLRANSKPVKAAEPEKLVAVDDQSASDSDSDSDKDDEKEDDVDSEATVITTYNNFPASYRGPCIAFPRDEGGPFVLACIKEREEGSEEPDEDNVSAGSDDEKASSHGSKSAKVAANNGNNTHNPLILIDIIDALVVGSEVLPKRRKVHMMGSVQYAKSDMPERKIGWKQFAPGGQALLKSLYGDVEEENTEESSGPYPSHLPSNLHGEGAKQLHMESSYVIPRKAKKASEGTARVCFRSRMMPKQLIAGDKEKAAMLQKRSARVIKLMRVENMKVIDEPVYLQDEEGAVEENVNLLPVAVLEILSEGTEVVTRKYRIEVSAANGEKLGTVDIEDDEDLKYVIGSERKDLLNCDVEERDMSEIFRHIIENRIQLNLATQEKRHREGGRREGMRQESAPVTAGTGSLVGLLRDTPSMYSDDDSSTEASDAVTYGREDRAGYWLRLFSKMHRMSGRGFRTVVMLEGEEEFLFTRPDRYFSTADIEDRFGEVDVVFNSMDLSNRSTTVMKIPGHVIWDWLPKDELDLAHVVRRERFGKWLISQLRMQYSILGGYHFELLGMDRELCRDQVQVTYYSSKLQGRNKSED